jgi:DNA-binding transcriptional ArsR family regulator
MRTNKKTAAVALLPSVDLCDVPCFREDVVARLRGALPDEADLEEVRVLFSALGDRKRLRILLALKDGEELCVCDVAHVLGVSVSTASHHLRKLRDLKLLKYRNDGKMAYYSLRAQFPAELVTEALRWAAI